MAATAKRRSAPVEPDRAGFGAQPVRPEAPTYNTDVGQFLLDYDAVRTAASPDDALLDFMQSTYEAAAKGGRVGERRRC